MDFLEADEQNQNSLAVRGCVVVDSLNGAWYDKRESEWGDPESAISAL